MVLKECVPSPLQIPNPLPLEVNMAVAVAGWVVCHGYHDKKVGGEWVGRLITAKRTTRVHDQDDLNGLIIMSSKIIMIMVTIGVM